MTNRNYKRILQSFAAGELSPEMFGRFEDLRVQSGAALCLNFITKPHGPAMRRGGFENVAECYGGVANQGVRAISFRYSRNDSITIELGHSGTTGYMRFHQDASPITFTGNTASTDPMTWAVKSFVPSKDFQLWSIPVSGGYVVAGVVIDFELDNGAYSGSGTGHLWTSYSAHGFTTGDPITVVPDSFAAVSFTIDVGNNWLVTSAKNGLRVNDKVSFTTSGSLAGTGISTGTTYYVVTVIDDWTVRVSLTRGGAAVTLTGTGSGTHTMNGWNGSWPSGLATTIVYYVIVVSPTTFRLASSYANAIATTAMSLGAGPAGPWNVWFARPDLMNDGDSFVVSSTLTMPSPLANNEVFYAGVTSTVGRTDFYHTREGVLEGSSLELVNVEFGGSDYIPTFPGKTYPNAFKRHYRVGELVEHARYSLTYYTVKSEHNATSFISSNFLLQDSSLVYTIGTPYAAADLFELVYTQSRDVMTFTHTSYDKKELRRYDTNAWWELASIGTTSDLRPPKPVTLTTTLGSYWRVANVSTTHTPIIITNAAGFQGDAYPSSFPLAVGDRVHVYIPGATINRFNTGAVQLDHDLFVGAVHDNSYKVDLVDPESGAPVMFNPTVAPTSTNVVVNVASATFSLASRMWIIEYGIDLTHSYKVTAVNQRGQESQPSDVATTTDFNIFAEGAKITLTWGPVQGAKSYRVYKEVNGLYGLLGIVDADEALEFIDDGELAPDTSRGLPKQDTTLSDSIGNRPGAVGYFDQRRIFAGTDNDPVRVWMTAVGTESDLIYHLPAVDSDSLRFDIAAREGEAIRHVLGLDQLFVFTDQTEYRLSPANSDVITSDLINVRPQSYIGSSFVRPQIAGRSILIVDNGGRVHEAKYVAAAEGFAPTDMSVRSQHLFEGFAINDAALSKSPFQVAWFTSTSGKLLGFTFMPEHEVTGWHQHEHPDGDIESVCTSTESTEDRVYVVVAASNGRRYMQRMGSMLWPATLADALHVDSSVHLSSVPAGSTLIGTRLANKTVQVLADGLDLGDFTVSASGYITMPAPAGGGSWSKVKVGLGYDSILTTMMLATQSMAFGSGEPKNISESYVRVHNSGAFEVGPSVSQLSPSESPAAGAMFDNHLVQVTPFSSWNDDGQLTIVQSRPLPLTVVSVTMEVA